eukprot:scaffold319_cov244-Pinguiococcus_pyrenoidosus.AAC.10
MPSQPVRMKSSFVRCCWVIFLILRGAFHRPLYPPPQTTSPSSSAMTYTVMVVGAPSDDLTRCRIAR